MLESLAKFKKEKTPLHTFTFSNSKLTSGGVVNSFPDRISTSIISSPCRAHCLTPCTRNFSKYSLELYSFYFFLLGSDTYSFFKKSSIGRAIAISRMLPICNVTGSRLGTIDNAVSAPGPIANLSCSNSQKAILNSF